MKRKIITVILNITVFVICAFTFSACGLIDGLFGNNSKHEHQYKESVIEPTCTNQGYTVHYCEGCGDSYKDNYTEIDPSNHYFKDGYCFYCQLMQDTEGLDYTLSEDRKSYAVTGIGTAPYAYIKIPSTNNGKPVTSIGTEAFFECTSITSIQIPDSVTSIGNGAFFSCASLGYIKIPDSVTSIGRNAFNDCIFLTSITIPGSVATLEYCLFYGCTALNNVTISDGVTAIGNSTFSNCTSLTSITIPGSVTSIDYFAFYNCTSLKSITIPGSIASVDKKAFEECTALTSITFGGTVSQWNKVAKIEVNNNSIGDYTVYCTDGEIAKDGTVTKK